jgi:aspartyl-tRNA(Asn)/glutamyl-tRNA(Gln) amidotransferase subunit A
MPDVCTWPVARIAQAIRDRDVSCEEVVGQFLERARRIDAQLACFIAIEGDAAMEQARAHDARAAGDGHAAAGALFGVPFAAKDIFVRDGTAPTAGARDVHLSMREHDSTVLQRLADAGAVSLGRLNLDQFGYAATGANPDFGDTRNPWDPAHIAGGSSGGAAAGVSVGALAFGIGSDTGGSGRIPASYCGVTGLKPTLGRVPKRGCVPLSYSQDTVSVIARSAVDVAHVLQAIAGHDALDAASVDAPVPAYVAALAGDGPRLDGVRVGVDPAYLRESAAPDVVGAIEAAVAALADLGASIVEVDLAALARYDVAATVLTWAEVSAAHSRTFRTQRDAYAPAIRARLETAQLSHGADHVNALRYQGRALREFLDGALSEVDVVATATTGAAAPSVHSVTEVEDEASVQASLDALRLNRPFNFLGVPAMSLPVGFDGGGLPIGLQLVSRPWSEQRLLACGAAYQSITDWHDRLPALAGEGAAAPQEGRA